MKRRREKHITRLHIILFFLVIIIGLIVFFVVKNKISSSNDKYKEYETIIEKSGDNYVRLNNIDIEEGYEKKIDIDSIQKQGLIISDITDACDGYLIIRRERNIVTNNVENVYSAYIKCGNKYKSYNYFEY